MKEQQPIIVGKRPTKEKRKIDPFLFVFILPGLLAWTIIPLGSIYNALLRHFNPIIVQIVTLGLVIGVIILFLNIPIADYEFWVVDQNKLFYFNNFYPDYNAYTTFPLISSVDQDFAKVRNALIQEAHSRKLGDNFQYNLDVLRGNFDKYTSSINIEAIESIRVRWWFTTTGRGLFSFPVVLQITLKDKSQVVITAMVHTYPKEFLQAIDYLKTKYAIEIIDPDQIIDVLRLGKEELYDYFKKLAKERNYAREKDWNVK